MNEIIRHPNKSEVKIKEKLLMKLEEDRSKLLLEQPFIALLSMSLNIIPVIDSDIMIATTDGESLYFNAEIVSKMQRSDRIFLMAHLVWHCALKHKDRRVDRNEDYWDIAIDHEVNSLLRSQKFQPIKGSVYFKEWKGKSAEFVYNKIYLKLKFKKCRSDY